MSALNVFVLGDEAHIVTDGAVSSFGVLMRLTNKAVALPHLGLVIGLRGRMGMVNRLIFALGKYCSQAAALEGLPLQLRKEFGIATKLFPKFYGFDLGVVGLKDGKPFARLLSSVERPGQPAFSWLDIHGLWASPPISDEQLRAIGAALPHAFDAAAITLVDAQRESKIVGVGSFVQATTVNADGITTRLLKTYPDQLFKRMDTGAAKSVPLMAGDWRG